MCVICKEHVYYSCLHVPIILNTYMYFYHFPITGKKYATCTLKEESILVYSFSGFSPLSADFKAQMV